MVRAKLFMRGVRATSLHAVFCLAFLLILLLGQPEAKAATRLFVWGDTSAGITNIPVAATNIVALAAGDHHIVAVRADGAALAWGAQFPGATAVPTDVTNAVAVAAGSTHSLALLEDGTTRFWGKIFTTGVTSAPPVVQGDILTLAPGPGAQHILATRPDGSVVECGNPSYGLPNVPAAASNIVGADDK